MEEKFKYRITIPGLLGYKTFELYKFLEKKSLNSRRNMMVRKGRNGCLILKELDKEMDFEKSIEILAKIELAECNNDVYLLKEFIETYNTDKNIEIIKLVQKAEGKIQHDNPSFELIKIEEIEEIRRRYKGSRNYEFDNRDGEKTEQSIEISNEYSQNLIADELIKNLERADLQVSLPTITSIKAQIEDSLQKKYSYNFGEKITITDKVGVSIPKGERIKLYINWELIYQRGYVELNFNNKIIKGEFKVPKDLMYSQKQERIIEGI